MFERPDPSRLTLVGDRLYVRMHRPLFRYLAYLFVVVWLLASIYTGQVSVSLIPGLVLGYVALTGSIEIRQDGVLWLPWLFRSRFTSFDLMDRLRVDWLGLRLSTSKSFRALVPSALGLRETRRVKELVDEVRGGSPVQAFRDIVSDHPPRFSVRFDHDGVHSEYRIRDRLMPWGLILVGLGWLVHAVVPFVVEGGEVAQLAVLLVTGVLVALLPAVGRAIRVRVDTKSVQINGRRIPLEQITGGQRERTGVRLFLKGNDSVLIPTDVDPGTTAWFAVHLVTALGLRKEKQGSEEDVPDALRLVRQRESAIP